jgi:alpha/beta hydrolase fold
MHFSGIPLASTGLIGVKHDVPPDACQQCPVRTPKYAGPQADASRSSGCSLDSDPAQHVRGLGVNDGDAPALLPRVLDVAQQMAARTGRPVRMVGWSMGGFLAREAARDRPDLVAHVVTMGTPVVGGPKYNSVAGLFRRRGYDVDAIAEECASRAQRCAIHAPITAIYSRRDGVVAWQACIGDLSPNVEHVEVASTHGGLGFDLRAWQIVADRLARGGHAAVSVAVADAR